MTDEEFAAIKAAHILAEGLRAEVATNAAKLLECQRDIAVKLLAEVEHLRSENAIAWAEVFKLRKQIEGDRLQPWER